MSCGKTYIKQLLNSVKFEFVARQKLSLWHKLSVAFLVALFAEKRGVFYPTIEGLCLIHSSSLLGL